MTNIRTPLEGYNTKVPPSSIDANLMGTIMLTPLDRIKLNTQAVIVKSYSSREFASIVSGYAYILPNILPTRAEGKMICSIFGRAVPSSNGGTCDGLLCQGSGHDMRDTLSDNSDRCSYLIAYPDIPYIVLLLQLYTLLRHGSAVHKHTADLITILHRELQRGGNSYHDSR